MLANIRIDAKLKVKDRSDLHALKKLPAREIMQSVYSDGLDIKITFLTAKEAIKMNRNGEGDD